MTQTTLDQEEALTPTLSRRTGRGSPLLTAVAPLIVVAIFAVGYAWRVGWPAWPLTDAGERIAYSAIAATPLAIAAALVRSVIAKFILNLVAAAICVLPTMWPQYVNEVWTAATLALWTVAFAIVVALGASLLQWLLQRDGQATLSWLVTLGMAAASGALLMSTGSLKLGEAGFVLAAAVGVTFITGLIMKPAGRGTGAFTLSLAVLGGLLISGHLWSELPLYAVACVLVAPLLACIVRVPILSRRPTWQRVVIGLIVAAIPAAAATIPLALKAQAAAESSEDYGY